MKKGIEPVHAIAAKYQIHPVQVSQWKQAATEIGIQCGQVRAAMHASSSLTSGTKTTAQFPRTDAVRSIGGAI
jgi:uncharacterized protein YjcR